MPLLPPPTLPARTSVHRPRGLPRRSESMAASRTGGPGIPSAGSGQGDRDPPSFGLLEPSMEPPPRLFSGWDRTSAGPENPPASAT